MRCDSNPAVPQKLYRRRQDDMIPRTFGSISRAFRKVPFDAQSVAFFQMTHLRMRLIRMDRSILDLYPVALQTLFYARD
jgi:hypothetical protein